MTRSITFGGDPQQSAPLAPVESNPPTDQIFTSRRARREFERAATGAVDAIVPASPIDWAAPIEVAAPVAPAAPAAPLAPAAPAAPLAPAAPAALIAPVAPLAPAEPLESADPIATVVPVEHPAAPTVSADAAEAVARRTRPVRRPPLAPTKNLHAHRARGAELSARARVRRTWAKIGVVLAASGLMGTAALPAYAAPSDASLQSSANVAVQTLAGGGAAGPTATRDGYTVMENPLLLDSTTGVTVSPTVQALAQKLMTAVAQGRLTGSVPNHIPEIQYLAEGRVVPNCGIDYRVLQTIDVALKTFTTVGVSDINRRCTGQIEGAGSASSHYANGGGHAVDFFLLDGQSLSGGDAQSVKLIQALDPIVPSQTNVGQSECRSSLSLANFVAFDDTCNHLHIDFGNAQGTTLKD
ncbi:hypothetical protein [Diaminobutyricibacter sp. McL0608]|uniref:hypothetical protein n=1 Tax=Leifsonia sp. McL0608 TaxID=3143537 RepID=UPI0031F31A68